MFILTTNKKQHDEHHRFQERIKFVRREQILKILKKRKCASLRQNLWKEI